jgi:hypothetical protein
LVKFELSVEIVMVGGAWTLWHSQQDLAQL